MALWAESKKLYPGVGIYIYIYIYIYIFMHPWILNILSDFLKFNAHMMTDFLYIFKYKKGILNLILRRIG